MSNGLNAGSGELHFTLCPIGTTNLLNAIENYTYNGGTKTIIVRMPLKLLQTKYNRLFTIYTDDLPLRMVCDYSKYDEEDKCVVPSQYILGWYDKDKKTFKLNDKHHFTLTKEDISLISNNIATHSNYCMSFPNFNKKEIERELKSLLINDKSIQEYRRNFIINNFIYFYEQQETEEMKIDYSDNYENDKNFILNSVKNKKIDLSNYVISEIYMSGKIDNGNGLEWFSCIN